VHTQKETWNLLIICTVLYCVFTILRFYCYFLQLLEYCSVCRVCVLVGYRLCFVFVCMYVCDDAAVWHNKRIIIIIIITSVPVPFHTWILPLARRMLQPNLQQAAKRPNMSVWQQVTYFSDCRRDSKATERRGTAGTMWPWSADLGVLWRWPRGDLSFPTFFCCGAL